jgi:hypothetical protein
MNVDQNSGYVAGNIAVTLLAYHNAIKIYHWQTLKYSRHKASDKLLNNMIEHIDQFVEILQGSWGVRVNLAQKIDIPISNMTDANAIETLNIFKGWLSTQLPAMLRQSDTDLLNKRDEMLSSINQVLYLFTFS